jgi:hypothetical protein
MQKLLKPSEHIFPAAGYHDDNPSLDFATPPVATALLVAGVVLPPLGQLDVNMLVDV